jgi:ferredoxin
MGGHDKYGSPHATEVISESVQIRIDHKTATVDYSAGDTILETARHGKIYPPFLCQKGNCGTCRALVVAGTAEMRRNAFLTSMDVRDGWILTCQAIPTSHAISVNYDAQRLLPGLRFFLRTLKNNPIVRKWSNSPSRTLVQRSIACPRSDGVAPREAGRDHDGNKHQDNDSGDNDVHFR